MDQSEPQAVTGSLGSSLSPGKPPYNIGRAANPKPGSLECPLQAPRGQPITSPQGLECPEPLSLYKFHFFSAAPGLFYTVAVDTAVVVAASDGWREPS